MATMTDPHYNVTKHLSPTPAMLVGHFYPEGFLGARIEQWRVPLAGLEREYESVVRRLKRSGKSTVGCANALYDHFKIAGRTHSS